MMISPMLSPLLETLEPSIDKYFSGLSCPELFDLIEGLKASENLWNVIWALMESTNPPLMQFFGIVLLRTAICSCNSDKLEGDYEVLRDRLLGKLSAIRCDSLVSSLCSPMTKKLFEALVQLIIRTNRGRDGAVRALLLLLTEESTPERVTSPSHCDNERRARDALTFLSILVEEFSTIDLSYHERQRAKQAILSDENFIFDFLKYLLTTQRVESIQVGAMQCCSLWMSTFSTSTCGTIEHTDLLDLIYQAMHQSELLLSVGLDCLITMFEEGGSELCSGLETVHLLDNHIIKLASLCPIFDNLIRLHSQAVRTGITWDEFEQKELLNKAVLLLVTLSEKQMEHLVRRVSIDPGGTNEALKTLFHMFLLSFSLIGSYPRDEAVSDLALQIWSNLLGCMENVTDATDNDNDTKCNSVCEPSFLRDVHLLFLRSAFVKCQYPEALQAFLTSWSIDEREQWYKLRGDLGDTLMLAYSHPFTTTWFVERCHLESLITAFQQNPVHDAWKELEASLFVCTAISEQVIHEFHHANPVAHDIASRVIQHLLQLIHVCLTDVPLATDVSYQASSVPGCLLAITVLQTLKAYSPVVSCLRQDADSLFLAPIIPFISSCFDEATRLTCYTELSTNMATTAVRALKTLIQELPMSHNQAVEMLDLVRRLACSHGNLLNTVEPQLAHCLGGLLSHVPSTLAIDQLLRMHVKVFEESLQNASQYLSLTGAHDKERDAKLSFDKVGFPRVISALVEFFRGFSLSVNKLHEGQINPDRHSPASLSEPNRLRVATEIVTQFLIKLIRLLNQLELQQVEYADSEFLNEISRFLQSALHSVNTVRRIDSSMLGSDTSAHLSGLLVHLLGQLLEQKTESYGSLLNIVWLVVDGMASVQPYDYGPEEAEKNTMLHLVSRALRHIDDSLMNAATAGLKLSDTHFQLADFGLHECLSHPIPANLLLTVAQQMTDQIESFATFLQRLLVWQPSGKTSNSMTRNVGLLDAVEYALGDTSLSCWRLCMTVGFTGICLPEWSTAEPCIRLSKIILERVSASPKAVLITPTFLFETHCNLLLILARGALPRRLITKYADLYAALSLFMPDKQFSLVCYLLECAETPNCNVDWIHHTVPYLQNLLSRVRQAVERTSVSERHRFASTVTRSCVRLKTVSDAIATFGTLCNQSRFSCA